MTNVVYLSDMGNEVLKSKDTSQIKNTVYSVGEIYTSPSGIQLKFTGYDQGYPTWEIMKKVPTDDSQSQNIHEYLSED